MKSSEHMVTVMGNEDNHFQIIGRGKGGVGRETELVIREVW